MLPSSVSFTFVIGSFIFQFDHIKSTKFVKKKNIQTKPLIPKNIVHKRMGYDNNHLKMNLGMPSSKFTPQIS